MSPFTKISLSNPADAKALVFSLLACVLFIVFLSAMFPRPVRKKKPPPTITGMTVPTPLEPKQLLGPDRKSLPDMNEPFRAVPEHFKKVDFHNHSYRLYNNSGPGVDVTLSDGEHELPENSGWFALQDVRYKDVTGDKREEAIVRLTLVKCGVSCDGGADLLYIYAMRNGKLTTLWQYQTGTRAYGCGLKTLTVGDKQLVLELFGECPNEAMEYPGPAKFFVNNLTYKLFEFDGRRFIRKTTEFVITASPANVKNYEPVLRVF